MGLNNMMKNNELLGSISSACNEIQQVLNEHLESTTNQQYKADIAKDVVTLENLKLITIAVKKDIDLDRIGASTELLLRIAANDFNQKLTAIPEKKAVRKGIMQSLKEVHRNILRHTIHEI
jgi:hypothetical protein